MANKGLRHYTGVETSNLNLGQTGFRIFTAATPGNVANEDGVEQFPIVKVLVDGNLKATTLAGDNFTLDGTAAGLAIPVVAGETFYGPFSTLTLSNGCVVAAYRG